MTVTCLDYTIIIFVVVFGSVDLIVLVVVLTTIIAKRIENKKREQFMLNYIMELRRRNIVVNGSSGI